MLLHTISPAITQATEPKEGETFPAVCAKLGTCRRFPPDYVFITGQEVEEERKATLLYKSVRLTPEGSLPLPSEVMASISECLSLGNIITATGYQMVGLIMSLREKWDGPNPWESRRIFEVLLKIKSSVNINQKPEHRRILIETLKGWIVVKNKSDAKMWLATMDTTKNRGHQLYLFGEILLPKIDTSSDTCFDAALSIAQEIGPDALIMLMSKVLKIPHDTATKLFHKFVHQDVERTNFDLGAIREIVASGRKHF